MSEEPEIEPEDEPTAGETYSGPSLTGRGLFFALAGLGLMFMLICLGIGSCDWLTRH
jgi:hypothetical protein